MNKKNDLKIRSKKVQKLLGEIPKSLVIIGYTIIIIIILGLVLSATYIQHPYGNGENILEHLFDLK